MCREEVGAVLYKSEPSILESCTDTCVYTCATRTRSATESDSRFLYMIRNAPRLGATEKKLSSSKKKKHRGSIEQGHIDT